MMNRTEVLAKIREHFSAPGAVYGWDEDGGDPEFGTVGSCVYRGGSDPKSPVRCAVGCLLPDEAYSPSMENESVYGIQNTLRDLELFDSEVLERGSGDRQWSSWLGEVQSHHDTCAEGELPMQEFLDGLERFA